MDQDKQPVVVIVSQILVRKFILDLKLIYMPSMYLQVSRIYQLDEYNILLFDA